MTREKTRELLAYIKHKQPDRMTAQTALRSILYNPKPSAVKDRPEKIEALMTYLATLDSVASES